MQIAAVVEGAQHDARAADLVDILGDEPAAGLQVSEQRRAREDLGDIVEREADAGFMGDGGQMEAGVGQSRRWRRRRRKHFRCSCG